MKGNYVTVLPIKDTTLNETSFVIKIEHTCVCSNCNNFETFVILSNTYAADFCVTSNYLVAIFDTAVKFTPLANIKTGSFSSIEELKSIKP
jgi:hypothetical protein